MSNETITAVPGIRVGHATHARGTTGCTVLLGPFRGACDVRGHATGTRELDALSPTHLVPLVDAILLTGGSAFGLAAADGVMQWVVEQGGGFQTPVARVPIVPAAVIFDLTEERNAPDASLGRAACAAATSEPVREGRTGAGAGATVGKVRGPQFCEPGGIGSSALRVGAHTMGAIAVVNALGDVIDANGRIVAGARADDGSYIDTLATLTRMESIDVATATNTTIAVVATDAPLTRSALQIVARVAANALARRIAPAGTPFDGDVVFAVSTSAEARDSAPAELLSYAAGAQLALERSILRAVQ